MGIDKGKVETPLKNFTIIFNSMIDSDKLSYSEKLVFIAIKRFWNTSTLKAFPSIRKICECTGLSKPTVLKALNSLEEKKILTRENRIAKNNAKQSNNYILHENESLWSDSEETEEVQDNVLSRIPIEQIKEFMKMNGYKVIEQGKEKEPESQTDQSKETDPKRSSFSSSNSIGNNHKSQVLYPMEIIKRLYEYDVMVIDHPYDVGLIDSVIGIIFDTLNSKKDSIRIAKEDVNTDIVRSKLLKLSREEIRYSINKYNEIQTEIKNPRAYLLTILYGAAEQMQLEYQNLINRQ